MPKRFPTVPFLVILITIILAKNFTWSEKYENGKLELITSDGIGYYAYLSSTLFDRNFSMLKADGRYFVKTPSGVVIKYYPGSTLLMAPFTGLAYLLDSDGRQDAFDNPYQMAIAIAALFYFAIGLLWLNNLLTLYQVGLLPKTITLVTVVFGTHLLNYVIAEPAMSHVYSWFAITGFAYYIRKNVSERPNRKKLLIASSLLGLIVLIRPVNGLIVFAIPFLTGNASNLSDLIKAVSRLSTLIPATLIVLSIIGIHPLLVYLQTSSLSLWTYANEGFYFLNPAIWDFLFSWRKGLFVYTPFTLICVAAILRFWKRKFLVASFIIFFSLVIYTLSAWWNWYYGPSFSQRPIVEYLSILAIPLALFLSETRHLNYRISALIILTSVISLNLIQTYQYNRSILSKWDMTKEKYLYAFLKTGKDFENVLGGSNDIPPYKAQLTEVFSSICTMDEANPQCKADKTKPLRTNSNNLAADYADREFNLLMDIPTDSSFTSARGLYAKLSLTRLEVDTSACTFAYLVIHFSDEEGGGYSYHPIRVNLYPNDSPGQIQTWHYNIELPPVKSEKDLISVYVWNPKKLNFMIDDLNARLFRID